MTAAGSSPVTERFELAPVDDAIDLVRRVEQLGVARISVEEDLVRGGVCQQSQQLLVLGRANCSLNISSSALGESFQNASACPRANCMAGIETSFVYALLFTKASNCSRFRRNVA